MESINGLVMILVVSRRRYGPIHISPVVVWKWRVPHAVSTHS